MANPPIGNNFIDGPLGVVKLEFDNVDYGKTLDNTELETIEDIKDIFHAQDGTQPWDKIPTGMAKQITCQFSELDNPLIGAMIRGVSVSGGGNSLKFGRDIYRSGRDNFAKRLKVSRVDSDGVASTNVRFVANYYKAMPTINGPITFGPDEQKILSIIFYIFYDTVNGAFGYTGYPTSNGLAAAT